MYGYHLTSNRLHMVLLLASIVILLLNKHLNNVIGVTFALRRPPKFTQTSKLDNTNDPIYDNHAYHIIIWSSSQVIVLLLFYFGIEQNSQWGMTWNTSLFFNIHSNIIYNNMIHFGIMTINTCVNHKIMMFKIWWNVQDVAL